SDFPFGTGLRGAHRAVPLEHDAFLDDEARRRHVSEELAGGADLELLARADVAGHLAAEHDRLAVDLSVDHRRFGDEQGRGRDDLSLDVPRDAGRALEGDLAGKT